MTTTYADAPSLDYEAIRELLSAKPPATLPAEKAAEWYKRRDYWMVQLFPELKPAMGEPVFSWSDETIGKHNWSQSEEDWIRTGC
jgi:hypothetical protein